MYVAVAAYIHQMNDLEYVGRLCLAIIFMVIKEYLKVLILGHVLLSRYGGNPSLIGSMNGTQASSKKSTIGIIIGAVLGASIIIILLCVVGVYFLCHQRKKGNEKHQGAIGMNRIINRPNGTFDPALGAFKVDLSV